MNISSKLLIFFCISGSEGCFDIRLTTKFHGDQISWSVGSCMSSQLYSDDKVFTQECCLGGRELLFDGNYKIICMDSGGDGWHGGYLEINGQQYCKDFNGSFEQDANLTIASG